MIKKHLFFALVATALFSACSDEADIKAPEVTPADAEQIINLMVSNVGNGLTTRAGRPLYSEAADQAIDEVKIIITNSADEIVYATEISDWMTNSGNYANGRQSTLRLVNGTKGTKLAADEQYTIYGYGYTKTTNSEYTDLNSEIASKAWSASSKQTFTENTLLTLSSTENKGEEIFAGKLENITVNEQGGINTTLVLTRQVAGTYGYFKNIPYVEGVSKLVLKASVANLNNQLVLGQLGSTEITNNGNNTAKYIVNATSDNSSLGNIVYSINLSDWFTEIKDDDSNGIIDIDNGKEGEEIKEYWVMPATYANEAAFNKGSVFGGTFLIPFTKVTDAKTFVLELQDGDGNVLKSWNIKLSSSDTQIGKVASNWLINAFADAEAPDDVESYSILRNHLYSVGKKTTNKAPNDPDNNPDAEDDPEDLSKTQELTLQVNDNWEVIHKMELE